MTWSVPRQHASAASCRCASQPRSTLEGPENGPRPGCRQERMRSAAIRVNMYPDPVSPRRGQVVRSYGSLRAPSPDPRSPTPSDTGGSPLGATSPHRAGTVVSGRSRLVEHGTAGRGQQVWLPMVTRALSREPHRQLRAHGAAVSRREPTPRPGVACSSQDDGVAVILDVAGATERLQGVGLIVDASPSAKRARRRIELRAGPARWSAADVRPPGLGQNDTGVEIASPR